MPAPHSPTALESGPGRCSSRKGQLGLILGYEAMRGILVTAEALPIPMSVSKLPSPTSSSFPGGFAGLCSVWELLPFPRPTSKSPLSPPPSSHLPPSPPPRFTVTR